MICCTVHALLRKYDESFPLLWAGSVVEAVRCTLRWWRTAPDGAMKRCIKSCPVQRCWRLIQHLWATNSERMNTVFRPQRVVNTGSYSWLPLAVLSNPTLRWAWLASTATWCSRATWRRWARRSSICWCTTPWRRRRNGLRLRDGHFGLFVWEVLICSELKCLDGECGEEGYYDCGVISVHGWEWKEEWRSNSVGNGFCEGFWRMKCDGRCEWMDCAVKKMRDGMGGAVEWGRFKEVWRWKEWWMHGYWFERTGNWCVGSTSDGKSGMRYGLGVYANWRWMEKRIVVLGGIKAYEANEWCTERIGG